MREQDIDLDFRISPEGGNVDDGMGGQNMILVGGRTNANRSYAYLHAYKLCCHKRKMCVIAIMCHNVLFHPG